MNVNFFDIADKFADTLLDIVYPKECIFCHKKINSFGKLAICPKCADTQIKIKIVRDDSHVFDEAVGILKYEGNVRRCMIDFKFRGIKYYGHTFAYEIYRQSCNFGYIKDAIMCCVPISRSRKRAYNQTAVIADELTKMLDQKCCFDLLYKRADIPQLSKMSLSERRMNIRGAFGVNPKYNIYGKDIVVIDDIFTSGSTADECARTLKMYGAANVYVVCACYD